MKKEGGFAISKDKMKVIFSKLQSRLQVVNDLLS